MQQNNENFDSRTMVEENNKITQEKEKKNLKESLALVFDDDFSTKAPKWNSIPDYIIIGVIILSTIEVFLSTFNVVVEHLGSILKIIDWFTVIFFTIEIVLRIWTADLLDEKYKGFWGRVRYCFSFYGFIDLVSTVPFYLNFLFPMPYSILKVFRTFRLLRLFRYMKSSRLLVKAVSSKKDEMLTSMAFLTLLTIILSFLLYFSEHAAQPELCENGWSTFLWTFAKYLGDPGKIADFTLISPWSNIIAFIVGILGVAIFAIPAGLIASGFIDAMDEEKRENKIDEFGQRMSKSFKRSGNKTLRKYLDDHPAADSDKFKKMNFVSSRVPVSRLQIRQGFEFKDIYDVCEKFKTFRLKNLAEAISNEEHPEDRFVVEHFPVNRPYGYCIDRLSKVTIVSASSYSDCGTGWFTYYLAKFGGFNYISKDIEVDPDELDSFFNMSPKPVYNKKVRTDYDEKTDKDAIEIIKKKQANRDAFIKDLKEMATGEDSWIILFAAQINSSVNKFDFHISDSLKDESKHTVHDQQRYQQLLEAFDQMMKTEYKLTTSLQSQRFPLTEKNLGFKLRDEGTAANIFAVRPSTALINFNNSRMLIAFRMAMLLSDMLDNGKGIDNADVKDFASDSFGYLENNK